MKRGLIVSCQALSHEPLHSPFIMGRMAKAAEEGGAVGIRANGVEDIREVKREVNLPIIGIIKKDYDHLRSYITPTRREVELLVEEGVDVIAMDATIDADRELLRSLKKDYPDQKFMADISTVEEGLNAEKLGFDYIGLTLVGYTEHSKGINNFEVLKDLVAECRVPVVAEGNFDTPEKVRWALEMGAYTVVVGSAITRPQLITKKFVEAIEGID